MYLFFIFYLDIQHFFRLDLLSRVCLESSGCWMAVLNIVLYLLYGMTDTAELYQHCEILGLLTYPRYHYSAQQNLSRQFPWPPPSSQPYQMSDSFHKVSASEWIHCVIHKRIGFLMSRSKLCQIRNVRIAS